MNLLREMLAEFVATMIFVFIGAGSIVFSHWSGTTNGLVIAVAHGLGIFIAISVVANISGGHLNPAVTFFPYEIKGGSDPPLFWMGWWWGVV